MGYPWQIGDALLATDLNAAIASAGGGENVLVHGADPTGIADSSAAINAAAAVLGPHGRNKAVYIPAGWYRVNNQINLTKGQLLYGDTRGSSFFVIDQYFNPAASAVISCTSGGIDPGPVIRDLGITFVQPETTFTRAGMKTLAEGGGSFAGGSGVKYPWAIVAASGNQRIQIVRVRIGGAWNGISSNNNNAVFWLEDIEMGALGCGLSLGEGTGILDACHINGYHFWNFDLTYAGQIAVMSDGQTIAARFGEVDGLDAKGFGSIWGRVVFTPEATRGWFAFANLALDTDATLEIADAHWLQIANLYLTTAGNSPRPLINVSAGTVQMSNVVAIGSATLAQPLLSVRGGQVSVSGMNAVAYTTAQNALFVDGGALRVAGLQLYPGTASSYSAPLVFQGGSGSLQITHANISGAAGSFGPAVHYDVDNLGNVMGEVVLGTGWVTELPAVKVNGLYGLLPLAGGKLHTTTTYANDAAAATGGVSVGQLYRNGSQVMVRVA